MTALAVRMSIVSLSDIIAVGMKSRDCRSCGICVAIALAMRLVGAAGMKLVPPEYFGVVERVSVLTETDFFATICPKKGSGQTGRPQRCGFSQTGELARPNWPAAARRIPADRKVTDMKERKSFWDTNAKRYDRFMRKDAAVYEEMYELLRPAVRHRTVLELATGTGLIAKHIVNAAEQIEATDASGEMIAEARRDNHSAKLHFSVEDMFRLPYAGQSFDVVIVSNALHIVPQPEKALREIRRVLKDDGVLIAPTFTHAENSLRGRVRAFCMKLAGFLLHSRWTSEAYLAFLRENGWTVRKSAVLRASFPLTYVECVKAAENFDGR